MTTAARQPVLPRWALSVLAAMAAVLAVLVGPSQASASTTSVAQTRVGASTATARVLVGATERVCAGQPLGEAAPPSQIASATGVAAKTAPELASGLERTGSALSKSDSFHRSVSWVVDNPAAQRFAIKGGDGVGRELYQLSGEVNGKSGVFEWIIDRSGTNPVINHQRSIPGGSVTGYPNQVVP